MNNQNSILIIKLLCILGSIEISIYNLKNKLKITDYDSIYINLSKSINQNTIKLSIETISESKKIVKKINTSLKNKQFQLTKFQKINSNIIEQGFFNRHLKYYKTYDRNKREKKSAHNIFIQAVKDDNQHK